MNHSTDHTNGKAPGACNTEGLTTYTTNDLNFATGTQQSKSIFDASQAFARRLGVKP